MGEDRFWRPDEAQARRGRQAGRQWPPPTEERSHIFPSDKHLGGLHCTAAKKLLVREFQREKESLQRLKDTSPDFLFAQADDFYYQKQRRQWLKAILKSYKPAPVCGAPAEDEEEEEEEDEDEGELPPPPPPPPRPRREEAGRSECRIPDRELRHIQRHIDRTERARGLRDARHRRWVLRGRDIPSRVLAARREAIADEALEPRSDKQQAVRVSEQIRGHQDRMLRGRRLSEQKRAEEAARRIPSQVLPLRTQPRGKRTSKEVAKEFEWVTTYPIIQPSTSALIKVANLVEKSPVGEPVRRPPERRMFLSVPPFLRSQLVKLQS